MKLCLASDCCWCGVSCAAI